MPTFGRDTIRKFSNDVSAMKRLAARDWEDILQVRFLLYHIPVMIDYLPVRYASLRRALRHRKY
jgi:hypothetical protein